MCGIAWITCGLLIIAAARGHRQSARSPNGSLHDVSAPLSAPSTPVRTSRVPHRVRLLFEQPSQLPTLLVRVTPTDLAGDLGVVVELGAIGHLPHLVVRGVEEGR